jgi:hypothetical protein
MRALNASVMFLGTFNDREGSVHGLVTRTGKEAIDLTLTQSLHRSRPNIAKEGQIP